MISRVRPGKKPIFRVLDLVGVSPKCYEAAVREQTRKGVNIILARDVDEMYINNYNPEWIRAWDANIDIQPMSLSISQKMKVELPAY
jgi:hypothetical protein